jgi:hypothetical protein
MDGDERHGWRLGDGDGGGARVEAARALRATASSAKGGKRKRAARGSFI